MQSIEIRYINGAKLTEDPRHKRKNAESQMRRAGLYAGDF